MFLVSGGYVTTDSTEIYDPILESWRAVAALPSARRNLRATSIGNRILFFGKNNFNMTFKGQHNVHVLKVNAIAQSGMLNSSSNPAYTNASASLDTNDQDKPFVYITGINFHDENLNVVAKTQLAQPIIKRTVDSYLFKAKLDF